MNHLRILGAFSFCLLASSLFAEEPQPAKLYEQGVNAYFGGRSCQADALLSEAIQWNSQDPLAYYFRASRCSGKAVSQRHAAICS